MNEVADAERSENDAGLRDLFAMMNRGCFFEAIAVAMTSLAPRYRADACCSPMQLSDVEALLFEMLARSMMMLTFLGRSPFRQRTP